VSVLFLPSAAGRVHLTRLLLVARALRERGERAVFAYGGVHAALLDADGFERLPVADVGADVDPRGDVFAGYGSELVSRAVTDVVAAVGEVGATALVFGLHPAGAIAARVAGVPCASVTTADLTAEFDVAGVFGRGEGTARLLRPLVALQARSAARALRRVARAHELRDLRSVFDFQRGDATLLADVEEWAPVRERAPGTRYVGPLVWEDDGAPPGLEAGTVIHLRLPEGGNPRLLETAREAFGSGFRLVVSEGGAAAAPGGAAALVIHCGEREATYQALAARRPVIVVPDGAAGRIEARLVTRHRVGVAFEPDRLDAARLRDAAERVLATPGYTVAADHFARLITATDGPAAVADAVASL
jgi:UDP:flavonoid glycosyltransferase YjiC (YdhE family)